MTATLRDFLLERLAEDEAVSPLNWLIFEVRDGIPGNYAIPDRVKAERAAKRAIVARHHRHDEDTDFVRFEWQSADHEEPECVGCGANFVEEYRVQHIDQCPELRSLASIYSDHPDYDEGWRPAE